MKTCWSSPWQSGRNIDQLELTSIVWKIFSTTLSPLAPLFRTPSDGDVIALPNTFKEEMESSQSAKWKEALDKEITSLEKHEVFDIASSISALSDKKVIGTKWVSKVKADHTVKGRVVVQGWGQVPRVDCGCTYAPVCHIQNIRMALTIGAHECWEVHQLHVQTAFLKQVS